MRLSTCAIRSIQHHNQHYRYQQLMILLFRIYIIKYICYIFYFLLNSYALPFTHTIAIFYTIDVCICVCSCLPLLYHSTPLLTHQRKKSITIAQVIFSSLLFSSFGVELHYLLHRTGWWTIVIIPMHHLFLPYAFFNFFQLMLFHLPYLLIILHII